MSIVQSWEFLSGPPAIDQAVLIGQLTICSAEIQALVFDNPLSNVISQIPLHCQGVISYGILLQITPTPKMGPSIEKTLGL